MTLTVDSHVHFWDKRHPPQPWMTRQHASIARPFGPQDLRPLLRCNGIDAAIVVQALLHRQYDRVWQAIRTAVEVAVPDCADALLGSNACRI